jgi:2,4-dienoyl-CoA reductase (NADPH2)
MAPLPSAFPLLERPLQLRGRELANRLVLAPMSVGYGGLDGQVTERVVEHYARRARGGAAMVITENIAVSAAGRQLPRQMIASEDSFLPGLTRLASAIKEQGALAVAQIVHSGRYAGPWHEYEARRRLAPSAVECELKPGQVVSPDEITEAEIEVAIGEFRVATALLRRAGFDGVEIHGAQGFLISSFQSPRMNLRDDEYGRDRNLFARRVIAAVAEAAGDELIVGFHLMSDEMMEGGWTPADAVAFAAELDPRVDFLVPIPTTFESLRARLAAGDPNPSRFVPEVGRALSATTSIPVFANGALSHGIDAEAAIADGGAEAVLVGKGILCDPDLPAKILGGREAEAIRCDCTPPLCLQTQLEGSVCKSWPAEVQERGFWGLDGSEAPAPVGNP